MSVHALLNLLNKRRESDKMRDLRDLLYATLLYVSLVHNCTKYSEVSI